MDGWIEEGIIKMKVLIFNWNIDFTSSVPTIEINSNRSYDNTMIIFNKEYSLSLTAFQNYTIQDIYTYYAYIGNMACYALYCIFTVQDMMQYLSKLI